MQFSKLPTKSTVLKYLNHTEENHIEQNEEKDCATSKAFKNEQSHVTMNESVD